jgi:O-succinylbenzoic acid--CoA ligase
LDAAGVEGLAAAFGADPAPWQVDLLERLRAWGDPGVEELVFTTSGSTGAPVAWGHPRARLVASADRTLASPLLAGLAPAEAGAPPLRALLAMPARFVGGWMMVVRAWRAGWELTLVEPRATPEWREEDAPFDFVALTPMQALALGPRLAAFRRVLLGGAAVPPSAAWPPTTEVWSSFGMTETASHVALRRLHPHPEPAFTCLPGVTYSLDGSGALLLRDTHLDLPPLLTRDAAAPGPTPTSFHWLGRLDDVINTGGLKVHPAIVEQHLAPAIGEAFVVFGLPHPTLGQQVAIRIDGPEPDSAAQAQLRERARDALSAYLPKAALPRHWEWAPLERTESGKWKRP